MEGFTSEVQRFSTLVKLQTENLELGQVDPANNFLIQFQWFAREHFSRFIFEHVYKRMRPWLRLSHSMSIWPHKCAPGRPVKNPNTLLKNPYIHKVRYFVQINEISEFIWHWILINNNTISWIFLKTWHFTLDCYAFCLWVSKCVCVGVWACVCVCAND